MFPLTNHIPRLHVGNQSGDSNVILELLKEFVHSYIDMHINFVPSAEKQQLLMQCQQACRLVILHIKEPSALSSTHSLDSTLAKSLYRELIDDPQKKLHRICDTPVCNDFVKFIDTLTNDHTCKMIENPHSNLRMSVSMRALNRLDCDKFKQIRLECLKNETSAFGTKYIDVVVKNSEYWARALSSKEQIFFGLFLNGERDLVSIAGLLKNDEGDWLIIGVYTTPEFRGKQLMIQLMGHLINYFRNANLGNNLLLKVLSTNNSAINLYKKLGFTIIKKLDKQLMGDGNYHTQYLMRLGDEIVRDQKLQRSKL
jgi:ribosomal protein S18 acetylase RimI-like enzyme